MKIPFNWLKEYVPTSSTIAAVAKELSFSGTEISSIESDCLEVDILPNRGDCLSVIGIAREVASAEGLQVKYPEVSLKESAEKAANVAAVEVKDKDLCPRYMARIVRNVLIKESPDWMKKKLTDAGMRPINNIVDVTNYVLLEMGQPLHAFDLSLISGNKIIVRRASAKETITTLDGVVRELEATDLLICDENKAIALAGVMGGANSEVTPATKDVLIESAYFDPVSINRTSKSKKLRTEASVRFERGVNWDGVPMALDRAAQLMAEISGGTVLGGAIDVAAEKRQPAKIILRSSRISAIMGFDIGSEKVVPILKGLGFGVSENGVDYEVTVPLYRARDIEREIDLIEEVARVYGYDKIPETQHPILTTASDDSASKRLKKVKAVKRTLLQSGFNECKTYSLQGKRSFERAGLGIENAVAIANPLIEEMTHLRTSIIPGLLEVLEHNRNRQVHDVAVFEVGKVFSKKTGHSKEKEVASALLSGSVYSGILENDRMKEDLYFLKGIAESIISVYGSADARFERSADQLMPNGAEVFIGDKKAGFVGALRSDIRKSVGVNNEVFIMELDLDVLSEMPERQVRYTPVPKYPSVKRDIAMFIPEGTLNDSVVSLIKATGGGLVESVEIFDKFKGKDRTSVAYSVIYRSHERTLTDDEVAAVHGRVLESLAAKLNVEIRK